MSVYTPIIMAHNTSSVEAFLEPAQSCICFNLRKSARVVTQQYDASFRTLGLKSTQFSLLVGIRLLGTVTINRLAEAMVMDRTTLTRNLKPLETQGLIRTLPGADRREKEITLTTSGQTILTKALPLWKKAQESIKNEIGVARATRLLKDLASTVQSTKQH